MCATQACASRLSRQRKDFLGGREGQTIGLVQFVRGDRQLAIEGIKAENAAAPELAGGAVSCVIAENSIIRVGKPDRITRAYDDVVWRVELLSIVAIGENGLPPVKFGWDDATIAALAGEQTPLAVPGIAIGVAGRMAKDDRWLPFGDSNICSAGTSLRRRISRSAKQTGPSAHIIPV